MRRRLLLHLRPMCRHCGSAPSARSRRPRRSRTCRLNSLRRRLSRRPLMRRRLRWHQLRRAHGARPSPRPARLSMRSCKRWAWNNRDRAGRGSRPTLGSWRVFSHPPAPPVLLMPGGAQPTGGGVILSPPSAPGRGANLTGPARIAGRAAHAREGVAGSGVAGGPAPRTQPRRCEVRNYFCGGQVRRPCARNSSDFRARKIGPFISQAQDGQFGH